MLIRSDLLKVLQSTALSGVASLQALAAHDENAALFVLACAQTTDPALSYKAAYGDLPEDLAVVAASALLHREDVQEAWNDVLAVMLMGEHEAKVHLTRISRDVNVHPRERTKALETLLKLDGAFDRDGATWRIRTKTGKPEEAIEILLEELRE